MLEELEVLRIVSERLESVHVPYMLTGSFAMAYYGKPRMTRDLDLVVALVEEDIHGIIGAMSPESGSELQGRDVKNLLDDSMERSYLEHWAARLGVMQRLAEIIP